METSVAYEMVSAYLVEQFELERERIKPEANLFEDLELDSIDALDMIVMLESEIGMEIVENELKKIRTVDDIVRYIVSHIAS